MSRIILATFGSLGDLHPVLALACELRRRGHVAEIATFELYRDKITKLGFGFHPLRPELKIIDEDFIRMIMDGARGSTKLLRDVMFPAVRDMYADLSQIVQGADLLIASELVFAAPLLAAQQRAKWVSLSLGPLWLFSDFDPPLLPIPFGARLIHALPPRGIRAVKVLARLKIRRWSKPLRLLRRELGLPSGQNPLFEGKFSPLLDLALFSSVLGSPQPDWPRSTVQCGFCFYDEEETAPTLPSAIAEFLAAGAPPIVFTLGSAAVHAANDFYTESARAAQLLGRRALLLLGKNSPPRDLPRSILAWDYLPYAQVFRHGSAVVHQGGVGTTAQTLRAGRPMLVVPFAHDQFDNATRMVRLGAARTLSRSRYRAPAVARELATLLGESCYADAAATAGARVCSERGAITACDAIERLLR